ncbi:MAG: serine hydrolase domain-containing protein, partial [bacterium]
MGVPFSRRLLFHPGAGHVVVAAATFAFASLACVRALPAQQGVPQPKTCRLSREAMLAWLQEYDAFYRGVGGSAAIGLDGRIVFSGAWGMADLERGVPMTPATRLFVASVTKAFTGVALLKLAEDGRVDLDAPIQR